MNSLHSESTHFVNKIKKFNTLSFDEEYQLANAWLEKQDRAAMEKLTTAHLKLVVKIATGYRGYGLPVSDLISEGNLGMMHALKNYDPGRGFRFSTYAMWWIKASIQDYVLHTWSLVKIGTTAAQKKLFFSLKKTKAVLIEEDSNSHALTPELAKKIAKKLNVSEEDVWSMDQRIGGKDSSLNTPIGDEDSSNLEWVDWLADDRESPEEAALNKNEMEKINSSLENAMKALNERERQIIASRRLEEPPKTLEDLSNILKISRERVRQIEFSAFEKLKKAMKKIA